MSSGAWTLIEVLIVVFMVLALAILLLPSFGPRRGGSKRIECVNNLKQVCLAFKIWSGAYGGRFPMQVSTNDEGTREFIGIAAATFRHFEVMSNELCAPKVLFCPTESDARRHSAWTFGSGTIPFAGNSNLSYFVGVDATPTTPPMFLVGDRNLTNGFAAKNGLLELKTNQLVGWTKEMHNMAGNIGLADGSVQQVTASGLREALQQSGLETTRLAMP